MSRSVSRSRSASGRRDKKADRDRSRSRKSSRSPSPRKKEESRGKKDRRRSDSRRPRKEDRRRSRDSRGRGGDAGRERRNRGDGLSVLIRGLPDSTDKHELQDLIEKEVGEVRDVYIPKDYYATKKLCKCNSVMQNMQEEESYTCHARQPRSPLSMCVFPYKPRMTGFLCHVQQICDAVSQRKLH
ncbi:unnamed protein product [Amoebophrya sp. A120]|nr:unnamed protein product [Amoebophrya sp. A120]|eukprot:GSA120T00003371001.1